MASAIACDLGFSSDRWAAVRRGAGVRSHIGECPGVSHDVDDDWFRACFVMLGGAAEMEEGGKGGEKKDESGFDADADKSVNWEDAVRG